MSRPVLIVECDPGLASTTAQQLRADGYRVQLASTLEHARVLARSEQPALALLGDLEEPRGQLSLLAEIRGSHHRAGPWNPSMPAIVIGSSSDELEILRAFDAGADDYLVASSGYLHLRARIRALLRRVRSEPAAPGLAVVGPLQVDRHTRTVQINGRSVELRRLEFDLLWHLTREPDRVFSTAELLRSVWGYEPVPATRTVDTHASRLRRKITDRPGERWIVNVRRVGYRLI